MVRMIRPCFLVIDQEFSGSISTRKLVIETAKLNVITAYSAGEAIETLTKFSQVDGIIFDSAVQDIPCTVLIKSLRNINATIPIVLIGSPRGLPCEGADHFLDSFDPTRLLALLQRLMPKEAAAIEQHDRNLKGV